MPTYDYECSACEFKFEKFQSITAAPIRTCPNCHARKVRRLIGPGAGIIFKGSGFYQTDYRSDSYREAAKNDAPPSKDKSEGSSKKSAESSDKAKAD